MEFRVSFNPANAMPAAVRLTLALQQSDLLLRHCYAAEAIKEATWWYAVKVTKTEIRYQEVRGGPHFAIPTPLAISRMITKHDAGKPLRAMTVLINTDHAIQLVPARKYDARKRHDVDSDGAVKTNADGTTRSHKRTRKNVYSREGFTIPVFASA